MKFKKITQKTLPVIFSIVLAVGTSITGASATEEKTYLKDMDYPTIETNLKEGEYETYSYTEFEGNFQKRYSLSEGVSEQIECINAMKLWFEPDDWNYITDSASPLYKGECASYRVTYTLDGKYDEFCADLFTDSENKVDCEIIGDDTRLKMNSITNKSEIINLKLDVEDVDKLTINITTPFHWETPSIIFNNAYLTTGETPEKPTTPTPAPTEPDDEPIPQPTTEPDPVAPTGESVTNPTNDPTEPSNEPTTPTADPTAPTDEDIAEPTEKPTTAPTTPTSKSTTPTTKPSTTNTITNNTTTGKTAGTVNTGDTSFLIVAVLVIGIAGSATCIVRKVKHSK